MKTGSFFVAAALALSAAAANVQQANRNSNGVFGGNRGGFGNNNNNGGFFGQNGRNGQNNQNNRGNNNNNNNAGKNNQNNNTGKNNNQNTNTGKGAASTTSAAVSTSAAAATSSAAQSTSTSAVNSADAQSSLTLDPNVIATGFENNGQDVPTAGQVASLTSSNNFINFCLTVPNLPITNGKQITTGSCNPAPMGIIPSTDNMPSAKFTNPKNGDTIAANTAFTVTMAINNLETGNFVNAEENYFAAPQQLNAQGQIVGHSHFVIESLSALDQTTPTNPKNFSYFKGLNDAAVNGVLSLDVTDGLPAGFYRLASINTAANHQPVLVPIAQHGSLDDAVYFTVSDNGAAAAGSAASTSAAGSAASASAAATTAAAAAASSAAPAATATAAAAGGASGKGAAPVTPPAGKGKAPAAPARVAQPAKRPTSPSRGQNGRFRRSRIQL